MSKKKFSAVKIKINQTHYLLPKTDLAEIKDRLDYLCASVKYMLRESPPEDTPCPPVMESDGTEADDLHF